MHGGTDTTATFSSTSLGSPTFHNIGTGSLGYHGNGGGNHPVDAEFGRYLTGGVSNAGPGTITVTFNNTITQAYVQVIELCGNDTSNPIAQQAYASSGATGTTSNPYTANLPSPLHVTDFSVYFLNTEEDLGVTTPTSTPANTNLAYRHNTNGCAGTFFKDPSSASQSFDQAPTPTAHHWGTIAVEIKRP